MGVGSDAWASNAARILLRKERAMLIGVPPVLSSEFLGFLQLSL